MSEFVTRNGRNLVRALVLLSLVSMAIAVVRAIDSPAPARAATGPGGVNVSFMDSTALVHWQAVPQATGYQVTLIRIRDNAIMQQGKVPATQLAFDAQGIWPGEHYAVAVRSIDASGALSAPTMSGPGQSQPISRSTYNGFLDTMNLAAGQIDTNLWNEHVYYSFKPMQGDTFINGQLHGHLAAGCPVKSSCFDDQTVTSQNARVPFDMSGGRTLTVHGEVDLKGDAHQWFGAILSPQIVGPDRVLDEVDRFYTGVHIPQLELFTFQGRTDLLYAIGDGSDPKVLGSVPNPTGLNNVRDEIVWHTNSTHSQVLINGIVAIDVPLPGGALRFNTGYLTLFAENYPHSGGTNGQPACDIFPADCSVWHLDNWGFDAAPGVVQPATAAYYANGCGPYPGKHDMAVSAVGCGQLTSSGVGSTVTSTVDVTDASNLTSARVAFDALHLQTQDALTASVNGGAPVTVPYTITDGHAYAWQSYVADVPAALLHTGANTVAFHLASRNALGDVSVANVQLETVSSAPYIAPTLPPEPAPLGTWGGGSPLKPILTPTPTTSLTPAPGSVPISGVPCVVTLNGQQQSGTCSGTFTAPTAPPTPAPTPGSTPAPTPATTPAPTPGSTPTPTSAPPTPTATASANPPPTSGNARQAGINVEPSMRPSRYIGANPDSWWCVAPNCSNNADPIARMQSEMDMAKALGVANVRVEFPWFLLEPQRGVFDWSRADAIVAAANADGVQLQPIVVFDPLWACGTTTCAPNASDWQSFLGMFVGRYHSSIHYWEMWNEPDLPGYWTQSAAQYTTSILIPGYAAVKAADPTAQVIIGSPACVVCSFYNTVYASGGGNSFDIAGFHDYNGLVPNIVSEASFLHGILATHGQGNKPIWLGEFSISENVVQDVQQEALLQGVLTGNNYIAMAQWYNLRDDSSYTCCPPVAAKDAVWGLVQRNGTKKDGFTLLQRLIAAGLPPHQ